jgi:hypothetical protein
MDAYYDDRLGSVVVRKDGPWIVSVTPMLFNDRVLLTHEGNYPHFWTSGYCYDKDGSAPLAAAMWNPLVDERPKGYKKIAGEDRVFLQAVNREYRESA